MMMMMMVIVVVLVIINIVLLWYPFWYSLSKLVYCMTNILPVGLGFRIDWSPDKLNLFVV